MVGEEGNKPIRVQNSCIINDDFGVCFNELMKRDMPAKVCLELSQCIDKIQAQYEVLKRAQVTITKKYCVLDKDGNIISTGNNVTFSDINKKVKCSAELDEIMKEYTDIPLSNKIKIKDTEMSTPYKMYLLRDIVEVVSSEDDKK
jgi:hypothetical protein